MYCVRPRVAPYTKTIHPSHTSFPHKDLQRDNYREKDFFRPLAGAPGGGDSTNAPTYTPLYHAPPRKRQAKWLPLGRGLYWGEENPPLPPVVISTPLLRTPAPCRNFDIPAKRPPRIPDAAEDLPASARSNTPAATSAPTPPVPSRCRR